MSPWWCYLSFKKRKGVSSYKNIAMTKRIETTSILYYSVSY